MVSLVRGGGRPPLMAMATGLGIWIFSASSGLADGDGSATVATCPMGHKLCPVHNGKAAQSGGTLGYGPPGLHPGFQGFGLGYHPGYGYGGAALGPGADGGYPFYGGPGYPHPWPVLRRVGGINPFPYFGGPGYPTPACPNYFGGVGPLAPDQPVVTFERDPAEIGYSTGYGGFEGMIPYPETTFAPYVTIAATGGSSSGVSAETPGNAPPNTAPAPGEMLDENSPVRIIGIEVEPVVEAGRARGLKVTRVFPGSVAEKAGLHAGDVVLSINGYVTEQSGHLAWILANATPNRVLNMRVRAASDGAVRTIRSQLP